MKGSKIQSFCIEVKLFSAYNYKMSYVSLMVTTQKTSLVGIQKIKGKELQHTTTKKLSNHKGDIKKGRNKDTTKQTQNN